MFTRDEVLHKALKAANIDTIENGKALTFKQMLKKLEDTRVSSALRKEAKGKLRILSIAQVAGYLYSGLVLGVGIPKLNIYMTNKSEAKRKARLADYKEQIVPVFEQYSKECSKAQNQIIEAVAEPVESKETPQSLTDLFANFDKTQSHKSPDIER